MDPKAKDLMNLMFREGETVCVSHNKYAYHSIFLENALNGPVTLVPTNSNREYEYPDTKELTLVALNPIKGFRQDINCTAFRNFLVEMDYGPLQSQLEYVKKLEMPYSAVVFSGNKSLHFLISLDIDLPSEKVYRMFSEWILNVVSLADPNTQNPSRSIRIPGAIREPGKKQILVEMKGAVKLQDLTNWLNKFPDSKPKAKEDRTISEVPDIAKVKPWVLKKLKSGIFPPNRNKQWFSIAVEFALAGYSEEDTVAILERFFESDRDFKEREWKTTIRSAFKWTYERK